MEDRERSLIRNYVTKNTELKRLYDQHQRIEEKLTRLQKRVFLTSAEENLVRMLKRKKLFGVEKMMAIIAPLGASEAA